MAYDLSKANKFLSNPIWSELAFRAEMAIWPEMAFRPEMTRPPKLILSHLKWLLGQK